MTTRPRRRTVAIAVIASAAAVTAVGAGITHALADDSTRRHSTLGYLSPVDYETAATT